MTSADRLDVRVTREQLLSFCIKIGAADWDEAKYWGDLHFAQALRREFDVRGHRSTIQVANEWDTREGLVYDVALQLKGRGSYLPRVGQINVLWSISHPDDLASAECDGFDLVCVASECFAAGLQPRTATPVEILEQATDPDLYFPDVDSSQGRAVVFVGNSRGVARPIVTDLFPTRHEVGIWGRGWKGIVPATAFGGEHLTADEVRRVYSSAVVVLNDHWPDMRQHGYVSNRIYDALACGTLVISDDVRGLGERFGDAVLPYRSRAELQDLVDYFCSHPDEARERGARGRALVLAAHTFAHRVERLLELVERRRAQLGHRLMVRPGGSPA